MARIEEHEETLSLLRVKAGVGSVSVILTREQEHF